MPNYSLDARIAAIGPAGLPEPIGQKYYGDFKTVVAQKEVQDAFTAQVSRRSTARSSRQREQELHVVLIRKSGTTAP